MPSALILFACSVDGKALSFGCGKHGQVGHGDDENQLAPRLIEALEKKTIIAVGAGSIHSCFVTGVCLCSSPVTVRRLMCGVHRAEEGDLYLCGFGEHFHSGEKQVCSVVLCS